MRKKKWKNWVLKFDEGKRKKKKRKKDASTWITIKNSETKKTNQQFDDRDTTHTKKTSDAIADYNFYCEKFIHNHDIM